MSWRDFQFTSPSPDKRDKWDKTKDEGGFCHISPICPKGGEGKSNGDGNPIFKQGLTMICETIQHLSKEYPSGAIPWASLSRKDFMGRLKESEGQVDDACLALNLARLEMALEHYDGAYRHIFKAFMDRA